MADSKTSALPAVASVVDAQEFPVNDDGTSKKATAAQIKSYVAAIGGSAGSIDNRALRSDGAGGVTAQGSLITLQDDGTAVVNAVLVYPSGDLSDDEKIQLAASFLLASDVHLKWYDNVDISSGSAVVGLLRNAATNTLKVTNGANGDGFLIIGGARFLGLTVTAGPPSTSQLPSNKDFAIHIDTALEAVYLAYNNDGDIVKVALTV